MSDSDFIFEPINHPSVDILLEMAVKDGDLLIAILNSSDWTMTLSGGSVSWVLVSDVTDGNDWHGPDFVICDCMYA